MSWSPFVQKEKSILGRRAGIYTDSEAWLMYIWRKLKISLWKWWQYLILRLRICMFGIYFRVNCTLFKWLDYNRVLIGNSGEWIGEKAWKKGYQMILLKYPRKIFKKPWLKTMAALGMETKDTEEVNQQIFRLRVRENPKSRVFNFRDSMNNSTINQS